MDKITLTRTDTLPITLDELQLWCRIDDIGEETDLIEGLIKAAREAAEAYTGRILTDTSIEFHADCRPTRIDLPACPIRTIRSVEAEARDGTLAALVEGVDYKKRLTDYISVVRLLQARSEPTLVVTVDAGYETAADIPQPIKQAIAVHAASAYRGREGQDEANETFERLLKPYRLEIL